MEDAKAETGHDANKRRMKSGTVRPYGLDFQLITLRQAETDLGEFQWRYRELEEACSLVEEARKKIAARRSEIENRRNAFGVSQVG